MSNRVGIEFVGEARGALAAARQTEGAIKGVGKESKAASQHVGGFGSSLGKVGKLAGLAAGAAGLGALIGGLKIGIGEFAQSAKVAAQTNAVLKSTGGIAGVTADQVDSLATALMKKSGIDDEAIKSGENLLLTFTNIRNEAGRGNDVFTQSTKAITDMSVALGQDMKSSAIQVGKALNDPIKGVTALQRVGVSFTAAQKEQIKALVDSGKTMDAQKLILRELNKEFGGSAEAAGKTLPGQISILKESFNNFAGDLVGKAIPYVQEAISALRDHWPEIKKALLDFWNAAKPALEALVEALRVAWPIAQKAIEVFLPVLKDVGQVIAGVVRLVSALLHGDWSEAWAAAKTIVMGVISGIVDVIKGAAQLWWAAFGSVFTSIFVTPFKTAWTAVSDWVKTNWVDILVVLFGGLPGLLYEGIKRGWIPNFVTPVQTFFTNVGTWISGEVTRWAGIVAALPGKIADFSRALFATFIGFFGGAGIGGWVTGVVADWAGFIAALPGKIKDFSGELATTIKSYVGTAGTTLTKFFTETLAGWAGQFAGLPKKIGEAVVGAAKEGADLIGKALHTIFGKLYDIAAKVLGISSPSTVFADIGENIVLGVVKGIEGAGDQLRKAVEDKITAPIDWVKGTIGGLASDVWSGISGAGGDVLGAIKGILGGGGTGGMMRELGRKMAAAYGWTGAEWDALNALWNQESGWNPEAVNPSSKAGGIPQALPASKMGQAAVPKALGGGGNPGAQIAWGLSYIKSRYGDPLTAWGGYQARGGWYAKGGKVPGRYVGREDTIMARVSPGEYVVDRDLTRRLELALAGDGGRAAATEIHFHDPVFYGTSQRQAESALADAITPYVGRTPSYRSPI